MGLELAQLIKMQGVMFLLMLLGLILRRKGLLTSEGKKILSDLMIYIIIPCNVVHAFGLVRPENFLTDFGGLLLIAVISLAACALLGALLYRKNAPDRRHILQYATVASNAGFMGNAIVDGVFGPLGLVYTSVFLVPMRMFMWSIGISYFTQIKDPRQALKKGLTHPCILGVFAGAALLVSGVSLPSVIDLAVTNLSNCCTPISMLVIGSILVEVDFRSVFEPTALLYSLLRLVVLPLLLLGVCLLFDVDSLVTGIAVLLTGMPAPATTAILAAKYGGDEVFATKLVVLSTALSVVTVPLLGLLLIYFL